MYRRLDMDIDAPTALPVAPPKSRRKAYKPTIREAILRNAALPESRRLTNTEIAKELGVRRESVWVALSNLRAEGVITPKTEKPSKDVPGPAAVIDHAAIAERYIEQQLGAPVEVALEQAQSDIMHKDERARRLSQIARLAPSNVSVLAVKALDDQERGSGLSVGPPDPVDEAGKVDRLARIMLAVGKPVVERAYELAYPAVQAVVAESPAPVESLSESLEP
jgi:DNA-binding Lrp family transcriptional regulator